MNNILQRLSALALLVTLPTIGQANFPGHTHEVMMQTDRIIVKLAGMTGGHCHPISDEQLANLSEAAGVGFSSPRPMSGGAHVLQLPAPVPLAEAADLAKRLAAFPGVEYAEPDTRVHRLKPQ